MQEIYQNPLRIYRHKCTQQADEQIFQVLLEESDLQIIAPQLLYQESFDYLVTLRQIIKAYCIIDPNFQASLLPIQVQAKVAPILQDMVKASTLLGVGPFACVAGVIAEYMAKYLQKLCIQDNLSNSAHFAYKNSSIIVENGGDIYICGSKERKINLLLDPQKNLSINILANNCSICVSSAKIGHSLSFGQADFCLTRSKSGAIADAAATAYCNMLKTKDDIDRVVKLAKKNKYIDGLVIYFAEQIVFWGDIKLV